MVRVYANVAGLSKALAKANLVGADKRSLAPFIANFNRSYGLTDFVDAGEFKENADFKLREMLRLYAENAQCKHIYFAACHDAGYVSQLTAYRGHSDRFTLVKTSGLHFHDEFTKLGLGIEELPGVFRATGSAMDAFYPKPPVGKLNTAPPPSRSQPTEPREVCAFHAVGRCKYGENCKNLHVGPAPSPLALRPSKLSRSSWRNGSESYDTSDYLPPTKTHVASSRNYLQQSDLFAQLPKRDEIPDNQVAINASQQRLDAYIPVPASDSENRLKLRSSMQRLCNAKHLTGHCPNSQCEYDHNPLEADLVPTLEWLARSLPCPRRDKCRNASCTSGHLCQKPDCKLRGGKGFCRFPWSLHYDDLSVDRYVYAISYRQSVSQHERSAAPSPSDQNGNEDEGLDQEEEEDISSPNGGISVSTL